VTCDTNTADGFETILTSTAWRAGAGVGVLAGDRVGVGAGGSVGGIVGVASGGVGCGGAPEDSMVGRGVGCVGWTDGDGEPSGVAVGSRDGLVAGETSAADSVGDRSEADGSGVASSDGQAVGGFEAGTDGLAPDEHDMPIVASSRIAASRAAELPRTCPPAVAVCGRTRTCMLPRRRIRTV
jgi:hypothetical protein